MRIPSSRDILNSAATPFRQLRSPILAVHSHPSATRYGIVIMAGRMLVANRFAVILPTVVAFVVAVLIVNFLIMPSYSADASILLGIHAGSDSRSILDRAAIDTEIQNQIEILMSRDFARDLVKLNKLAENPEFDPVLKGASPIRSLLALTGIVADPFSMTPEERVLSAWFERFDAHAVGQSSVIKIAFRSRDPDLAARVIKSIAERYIGMKHSEIQKPAAEVIAWPIVSNTPVTPSKPLILLAATLAAFIVSLLCILRPILLPAEDDPVGASETATP